MLVAKTTAPILPAHNELWAIVMWVLAAATLVAVVLLVVLVIKATGWLVGYQLGRLKHPSP